MTAPDLLAALAPLLEALRRLGVRHFVGGSIASSAHGVARASIDADVVAELRPEHVEGLLSSLEGPYFVPHLDTMLKVDVFVSRDRPFERRAMERAQPAASEPAGGAPLMLASAEDIVLAKVEWFRRGGEVSERQWADVLGVLRASRSSLDRRYMEEGARELGVADLVARALVEAERE